MTPITGLKSIVSCMAKASKSSSDEVAFKLFKKMTSGYGTDLSPIVYKGKNLDELPDMIKGMLTGLKEPTVTVNGRSRVNGQGIFGFKIQDGNKTISTSALGVDFTKGDPIIQLRGTYGNGTQQAIRFNTVFDTNLTGASALRGDVFVDRKLAQQLGVSDDIINQCIELLEESDGAMPVLPVKDTVYLSVNGKTISSMLNRDEVYAGQAPESFKFGKYFDANMALSDEDLLSIRGSSEVAFRNGMNIRLFRGSDSNYKITTLNDLKRFEKEKSIYK